MKQAFPLALLIAFKAICMVLVVLYAGIGLGPDEAQYWTWSRHLDWGYYSKPPGIAWQIFLGTTLFGDTELGVRFGAIAVGAFFVWATYRLALKAGLSFDVALSAALIAALTPLGIFASFLSITDGGMLVFWTLAFGELVEAVHIKKEPRYHRMGIFIALGALFKWPIYLFWGIVLVGAFLWTGIRSKKAIGGFLISLLGLGPTIYWNLGHDFATFRHVATIVQGGNDGGASGNPLAFIGSQVAIVSPLLFVLWLIALRSLNKERAPLRLLGGSSLFIFLAYVLYACFKKGQGNWCLFAYPGAFVYIAEVWNRKESSAKWLKAALGISIFLTGAVFLIPTWQAHGFFPSYKVPWKVNVFKHNLGWDRLEEELREMEFDAKREFLFADKYQMSSLLSFYNEGKTLAFFFNLLGTRKNQFSYWPAPPSDLKEGIFVIAENGPHLQEKLSHLKQFYKIALGKYFEVVEDPKEVSLYAAYGTVEKSALVFRCKGYSGKLPENPEKY